MIQSLVVLGATSKIAQEVARLAAKRGSKLMLVARNAERVHAVAGDLLARGAIRVETLVADLGDTSTHASLWAAIEQKMPEMDAVLLAYGSLSDQKRAEQSIEYTLQELNTNFISAVSLLCHASVALDHQKKGVLAVITSIAGDRSRRSNYVYGTAKGALTLFAQGLRARLFSSGVRVLTVKLGPVDTPMTASLERGLPLASSKCVAKKIYRHLEAGAAEVIYVPGYWRVIMSVVRRIPEGIGKKISF